MDNELRQRASESADRMTRAGMTLSAGIMQELIAEVDRLAAENAAATDYIHFLKAELMRTHAHNGAEPARVQELGEEDPQIRELPRNQMVLAAEANN